MIFAFGLTAGLAASFILSDWLGPDRMIWTAPILVAAAGLAAWTHEIIARKVNTDR